MVKEGSSADRGRSPCRHPAQRLLRTSCPHGVSLLRRSHAIDGRRRGPWPAPPNPLSDHALPLDRFFFRHFRQRGKRRGILYGDVRKDLPVERDPLPL